MASVVIFCNASFTSSKYIFQEVFHIFLATCLESPGSTELCNHHLSLSASWRHLVTGACYFEWGWWYMPPDLASWLPLAVAYLLVHFDLYYYYVSSFLVRLDDGFNLGSISLESILRQSYSITDTINEVELNWTQLYMNDIINWSAIKFASVSQEWASVDERGCFLCFSTIIGEVRVSLTAINGKGNFIYLL